VTVPVTGVPPTTRVELSVTADTAGPVAAGVTPSVNARVAEPCAARMSTDVLVETGLVETVNEAVSAPAGTVTLPGTVAIDVSSLDSVTTIPPAVAGAVRLTVPVADEPPVTESGLMNRLLSVGLFVFTVSVAVRDTPPALAVMTDPLVLVVVPAVIVNVALVAPAGTVTLAGTVAAVVFPLVSETTTPPAGAAALKVTVPVLVSPSRTVLGFRVRLAGVGVAAAPVVTVSTADRDTPPPVPVIVAELFWLTAPVVTVNVALVAPAPTLTLAGTPATDELLLDSATVWPPEGAAALSVTRPVEDDPPTTEVGVRLRAESVGVAGAPVTVHPDRRALAGVADASSTSMVQSAGGV
jgi:hypothetical protein